MGLLIGPVTSDQHQFALGTLVAAVQFSALLVSWVPWDFSYYAAIIFGTYFAIDCGIS